MIVPYFSLNFPLKEKKKILVLRYVKKNRIGVMLCVCVCVCGGGGGIVTWSAALLGRSHRNIIGNTCKQDVSTVSFHSPLMFPFSSVEFETFLNNNLRLISLTIEMTYIEVYIAILYDHIPLR